MDFPIKTSGNKEKISEYKNEIYEIDNQIKNMKVGTSFKLSVDDIKEMVQEMKEMLLSGEPEKQKTVIKSIVKSIEVKDESHYIVVNLYETYGYIKNINGITNK